MHPRCEDCDQLAHGQYGPYDRWYCFEHGMAHLDHMLKLAKARLEDRCEDGPHCGCDEHRGGASDYDE
jgi:hypothetical protein